MAHTAITIRPSTAAPPDGSRTITITSDPTKEEHETDSAEQEPQDAMAGALRLRGARRITGPRVAWDVDVVDNEQMGKKKSKICCIYHKPRRFDESSSEESSSDSDSGSDSAPSCGGGDGHDHKHRNGYRRHRHHRPRPQGDDDDDASCDDGPGPNAYERQRSGKGKQKAV